MVHEHLHAINKPLGLHLFPEELHNQKKRAPIYCANTQQDYEPRNTTAKLFKVISHFSFHYMGTVFIPVIKRYLQDGFKETKDL